MSRVRLASTLLFFTVSISLLANSEPVAWITFSNPVQKKQISLVFNTSSSAEAYTELTSIDTMTCLHIPTGKYGYFRVDDATITENDRNLIVKITYFDEGLGSLNFQYNATASDNYARQSLKKTGSNTWVTATLNITNASFRNAQNNQADFRITDGNYIRSISISKGLLNPANEVVPVTSGSTYSEFKGKSIAGYQAWFTASDTNSGWVHWSNNTRPEAGNASFEIYPDVREYDAEALSPSAYADLGNGQPANLFSSAAVIDTHFKWMQETGIDGVALQRFIGDSPYPIINSTMAKPVKVKQAAEKYERIFYVCYDMSSGKDEDAWVESIKFDWVFNIEQSYALTSSPAYARVANKPVVQIWGPGFTSRVGNSAGTIELIEFLQSRGCYVIGGVPTHWRTESGDSKPGFLDAYKTYDMVSPWTPGRYKGTTEADEFRNESIVPDKIFCDANNLDYLPVLFPGFAWSTWNNGAPNHIPREAGNFLWRQAYNIKSSGIDQMYFAMFDEYDEATAIMKAATDWSMIPTDQYFLTLSADGIWVSSDFYLRVAGAATTMLKSLESPSSALNIPYSEGPVYYRNSFEKRFTTWNRNGVPGEGFQNLDPCFYKNVLLNNSNITLAQCELVSDAANAKSGEYAVKVSGNPNSASNASFDYKVAEVAIPVVEDLKLSFWKKTVNELGKYVSLDLHFESGKKLSQLPAYTDQNGASLHPATGRGKTGDSYQQFVCEIGQGELLGDKITAIVISYNKAASSDSYTAYFDDLLITTENISVSTGITEFTKNENRVFFANRALNFVDLPLHSEVTIYTISGVAAGTFQLNSNRIPIRLPSGIYLVSVRSKNNIYTQKVPIFNRQ
tara:strand:+ start:11623 stop:14175 length:2553 start_codon:yes stop_codon:yes gene_type:complete